MCYNHLKEQEPLKKCRVTIRSCGNGWSDNRTFEGEYGESEGILSLHYLIDKDKCRLTVNGGTVTQERQGKQCLKLTFIQNRKTECVIGEGSLSGSFEIYTRRIDVLSGKGGFKISLEYDNGADGERIKLVLIAAMI